MKFIMLAGVEGSGHGLVRSVFENFFKLPTVIDQGNWHYPLTQIWDCHNNTSNIKNNINLVQEHLAYYRNQGVQYCFDSASFPFGQPRDTLRRPNLLLLHNILNEINIEFKPIFITRHLIKAIYSGYRRGFTDNIRLQAKIIYDNACWLRHQQNILKHIEIKFEEMIIHPYQIVLEIAQFLNCLPSIFEQSVDNISPTNVIVPEYIRQEINDII